MFKSKKSIKTKDNNSTNTTSSPNNIQENINNQEAIAVNEETETNTHLVDDSFERVYMNMPTRQHSEEESFPSVRVKHSISYEYDEKQFEIFKDEYLFLINRTNQDWWLCLRLDENLTFFVPASYLDEVLEPSRNVSRLVPPPRPPPPPPKPNHMDSYSSTSSVETKPEVKQRNLLITNENQNRKSLFEYSAAEAIINDLEQHLDREEASFSSSHTNEKPIYENLSKLDTTNTNEDDEEENDEEEYEEEDEIDDEERLEKEKLLEELKIPAGWKMCMSGCKRHVFYNETTQEIVIKNVSFLNLNK